MAAENAPIQWSSKSGFLKDVIRDNKLPIVVKVAEGWLGENEDESFSIGDLVKLDFVQCIQSVRAFAGKEELLIPLVHKGRMKISNEDDDKKTLSFVRDIVTTCPRYILSKMKFMSEKTEHISEKIVKDGDILEFDRYIEGKGLVCKRKNTNELVVLSEKKMYKFAVENDENMYTITEMVDRFQFPQYVIFIEKAGISPFSEHLGDSKVKLVELISQDYIVCHHKPDSVVLREGETLRRHFRMLPTNREIIQELEVFTAIDMASTGYAMFVKNNFSKKINSNTVVNTLETEAIPKATNMLYLNIEDDELDDDKPPPIPPRRLTSVQEDVESTEESEYDYISTQLKGTHTTGAIEQKEKGSKIQKLLHSVRKLPNQIARQRSKKGARDKPLQVVKAFREDDSESFGEEEEEGSIYEQLDESSLNMYDPVQKAEKPIVAVLPTARRLPDQMEEQPLKQSTVNPATRPLPDPHSLQTEQKALKDMTVDELVVCLEYCKIANLARTCKEKGLDGCFLSSLSDEKLKEPPFCLELIDLLKINNMKKGWRPKL